jgi:hypothetical protein
MSTKQFVHSNMGSLSCFEKLSRAACWNGKERPIRGPPSRLPGHYRLTSYSASPAVPVSKQQHILGEVVRHIFPDSIEPCASVPGMQLSNACRGYFYKQHFTFYKLCRFHVGISKPGSLACDLFFEDTESDFLNSFNTKKDVGARRISTTIAASCFTHLKSCTYQQIRLFSPQPPHRTNTTNRLLFFSQTF